MSGYWGKQKVFLVLLDVLIFRTLGIFFLNTNSIYVQYLVSALEGKFMQLFYVFFEVF